jgi:Tol biopolymer transport system component
MRKVLLLVTLAAASLLAAATIAQAAFPGKNGKLVFDSPVPEEAVTRHPQVFTVDPDGGNLTQITRESAGQEHHSSPAWSPDGTQIALYAGELSLMNPDGTGLRRIPVAPGTDGQPRDWSPDGLRILFSSFSGSHRDLLSVALDGTGMRNHTGASSDEVFGAWSPDGERIAFESNFDTVPYRSDIWTVKADGTEDWVRLTNSLFVTEAAPDWSPDGSRLAFASGRDGEDYEIFTMRPDGSGVVQVTHDETNDTHPVWSPDGTRIAFARQDADSDFKLFVMNADGSDQHKLADLELRGNIDWQPIPNLPPDCSPVRATPSSLGAPNHRLLTVTISGATDPDGDAVDLEITGVTQDEPVRGPADAVATTQPHRVRLRAERDPAGDGRVYRIAFQASDGRGGTCTGFATASVRKGTQAIDSAPPSYDSFGS